jgi:hypothetical protein
MNVEEVTAKATRNASKSFLNVGRIVSLPKGTTLKEMMSK